MGLRLSAPKTLIVGNPYYCYMVGWKREEGGTNDEEEEEE
jgi:hypothetical protein